MHMLLCRIIYRNEKCSLKKYLFQSIQDMQHSVKETILLLRALMEEIQQNAEREKTRYCYVYNCIKVKNFQMKNRNRFLSFLCALNIDCLNPSAR